ncbi:MAG TPA: hypothetical protein PK367_02675 [Candidatus Paceibacterota bacterium]|nr:hypothetical protein [Candidatus Paceibacterota bacterium]
MFEKTSRENFEEKSEGVKQKEKELEKLRNPFGKVSSAEIGVAGTIHEVANALFSTLNTPKIKWLESRIASGKKKLGKIYEESHEEALKLNEEHNRLLENIVKAEEALRSFESDELGMDNKTE